MQTENKEEKGEKGDKYHDDASDGGPPECDRLCTKCHNADMHPYGEGMCGPCAYEGSDEQADSFPDINEMDIISTKQ